MKVNHACKISYNPIYIYSNNKFSRVENSYIDKVNLNLKNPNFKGNPISEIKGIYQYLKAQQYAIWLNKYMKAQPNYEQFPFRNISMEPLEGLQYGIKVFKGLTIKDIQYLCENLHVIAVKRGCNNMCGYCYADAKPSKREMSWEDFTTITKGFKTFRKRLGNLHLFGENLPDLGGNPFLSRSTELFYDADCMNLAIKDKKGKLYDFTDLATELYKSLGRRTVFDTSGWEPKNELLQKRAEKYAEYFSKPENMEKLNAFNLSFNTFNASYISAVKALKNGDKERYLRLKNKFTDRISNAIYTFTPLLKNENSAEKFKIMTRSFGINAQNAEHFDFAAMFGLIEEVLKKIENLYKKDLANEQLYVKNEHEIKAFMSIIKRRLECIDTALNSSGRMKQFMEVFKIKAPMQDHTETTKLMIEDLEENGRYHRVLAERLIDTDGKVYHMDYARFFATEIQLNIEDKTPTPPLANLGDFVIKKELINQPEVRRPMSDFS